MRKEPIGDKQLQSQIELIKQQKGDSHIAVLSGIMERQLDPLSLPITINDYRCQAVMDTESIDSLIQESYWKKLKSSTETWQSSRGQTFSLANGHVQTALGKVVWNCTLHGHQYPFRAFVMKDQDLTYTHHTWSGVFDGSRDQD